MAQKTVADLLDAYDAGRMSLDELAGEFAARNWSGTTRPQLSDAQRWGEQDMEPPGDDEWATVEHDSRISPAAYEVLAEAHSKALRANA